MKLCLEPDCWNVTAGSRCAEHERAHQRARNERRGPDRKPSAPYRKVSLVGAACWCCGTTEDLTRHHVQPLASSPNNRTSFVDKHLTIHHVPRDGVVPMCRSCNSSIGARRMAGLACPQHGGVVLDG